MASEEGGFGLLFVLAEMRLEADVFGPDPVDVAVSE